MKFPNRDPGQDFQEFAAAESARVPVPAALGDRVAAKVSALLDPSAWAVFARLSLVHFFSAVLTLSICPQFGVRFFSKGMGLMHWFMNFGEYGCMLACGSFFMGTSVLAASFVLRPEEVRVIRRHRLLELGSLSLLSFGALFMLNPSAVVGSIALAWLAGSILGGVAVLEAGWAFRIKRIRV